ncbi:unnamed protein product, partial [Discosporangium mesarthrocarpum]
MHNAGSTNSIQLPNMDELPFAAVSPSVASPWKIRVDNGEAGGDQGYAPPNFDDDGHGEEDGSAVVQAHRASLCAEDASKRGDLAGAARLHLGAAKGFLRAAREVQDAKVLASSLLLLADSHAAKAEGVKLRLRISAKKSASAGIEGTVPTSRSVTTVSGSKAIVPRAIEAGGPLGTGSASTQRPSMVLPDDPCLDDSIMCEPSPGKLGAAGGE